MSPPRQPQSSAALHDATEKEFRASPIEDQDVRAGFRSGQRELDDFFTRHALPNDRAGIGRTFVLRNAQADDPNLPAVVGFYTVSMAEASAAAISKQTEQRLPRYPMPVALVARLAVDERARGRGLGERLSFDALARVAGAADLVGCLGVIVDAKDQNARAFYRQYGFADLPPERWPRRMYLPIESVRRAMNPAR